MRAVHIYCIQNTTSNADSMKRLAFSVSSGLLIRFFERWTPFKKHFLRSRTVFFSLRQFFLEVQYSLDQAMTPAPRGQGVRG